MLKASVAFTSSFALTVPSASAVFYDAVLGFPPSGLSVQPTKDKAAISHGDITVFYPFGKDNVTRAPLNFDLCVRIAAIFSEIVALPRFHPPKVGSFRKRRIKPKTDLSKQVGFFGGDNRNTDHFRGEVFAKYYLCLSRKISFASQRSQFVRLSFVK